MFNDIALNDRTGGFYEFVSPELGKAVAKLRPSGMARNDYHVFIMEEFIAAVKSRKVSDELASAARAAVFKERLLERLPIVPSSGQTVGKLEASLQNDSKARLATVIQAACSYHVEVARKA